MMLFKTICQFFVLPMVFFTYLATAEIAVIVHPSNGDTLDKSTINKIFLGKIKSFPGGNSAVPINLNEDSETRSAFDKNVLNKSSTQVKAYWSKLMFSGKGTPPKQATNDAEMKSLVAGNPTHIGYIDTAQVDGSVKVILTF